MPPRFRRRAAIATGVSVAVLAAASCDDANDGPTDPGPCEPPAITRLKIAANPANALSAFATGDVRDADSVIVRYGVSPAIDSVTPGFGVADDSVTASLFGLRGSTPYLAQMVAFSRCGTAASELATFTTPPLPGDLPSFSAAGTAPAPGYVVVSAGLYGLVIDNTGRVVWYHRFPAGPGLNFQAQPNGRYSARPPNGVGEDGVWVELSPDGTVTRTLGCARGLQPRMHDLIAQPDGSYWLLCDEIRTMDLSAQGASSQARVLGTSVQRRAANGDVLFEWSALDHLAVELGALEPADRAGAVINWTHGNALDLDGAGNLLVSFRNLSEVAKIDTRTGAIVWRMGGARNQLTFETGDVPAFARQHGVRWTGGGRVMLLDNLGNAPGSRAERYVIDDARRTARLSEFYQSPAGIVAQLGGTAQALPSGNTLVSFGSGGGVEEYDAAGNVVWRLTGSPGYIFRAQRIRSLYRPGVGDPR
jgi:hypothetical protein